MISHSLKIVLFSPQIPPNTGCIARTCAATITPLHLIKPLGFDISAKAVKRAGLDYWPEVKLTVHENWESFLNHQRQSGSRILGFSPSGTIQFSEFEYQPSDWLLHGRESDGLPPEILLQCDHLLYIPMFNPAIRSLNLSVSVGISLYQAIQHTNNNTNR